MDMDDDDTTAGPDAGTEGAYVRFGQIAATGPDFDALGEGMAKVTLNPKP
jgi:hypothetical protein